jgi:hypothetical protein
MLNTYVVEGGIGKCTAFTALVPKLKEKAGQGIQVYTPYIDTCAFNPDIAMGYEQTIPLHDESKFKPQDPRNLLVDPEVVISAYKKLRS